MHDQASIERQWLLLRTLGARRLGISVREMARETGVADKTIRRDIQLFQKLGFPVRETNGERGRKTYRLLHADNVPLLSFTFDEALVIYLARPFLEPLAGTRLWEAGHSALKKIRATLSESASSAPVSAEPVEANSRWRLRAQASDQEFVPIETTKCIMLLDWTGRELRREKRGAIPDSLAPILDRLGIDRSNWVNTVSDFGRMFKQAAGRASTLARAAPRCSRR
jgi:HTH domain